MRDAAGQLPQRLHLLRLAQRLLGLLQLLRPLLDLLHERSLRSTSSVSASLRSEMSMQTPWTRTGVPVVSRMTWPQFCRYIIASVRMMVAELAAVETVGRDQGALQPFLVTGEILGGHRAV